MSHLQKVDCSERSPSANLCQHHPPHLGQHRHKHKQLNAGSSIHLYLSSKSETNDSGQYLAYLSIYYTDPSTCSLNSNLIQIYLQIIHFNSISTHFHPPRSVRVQYWYSKMEAGAIARPPARNCNISVILSPRKCSSPWWPLRGVYDIAGMT